MPQVPLDTRFIGIAPSVNLTEKKSSILNAETAPYTMQDIKDSVGGGSTSYVSIVGIASNIDYSAGQATISILENTTGGTITTSVIPDAELAIVSIGFTGVTAYSKVLVLATSLGRTSVGFSLGSVMIGYNYTITSPTSGSVVIGKNTGYEYPINQEFSFEIRLYP